MSYECPHCKRVLDAKEVGTGVCPICHNQLSTASREIPPSAQTSSAEPLLSPRQCPTCGGNDVKKVASQGGFSVNGDRMCNSCGTLWRPPFAKGWAVVAIIAAALLLFAAGVTFIAHFQRGESFRGGVVFGAGFPLLAGTFGIFAYGIAVLCGKAGRGHVIREGSRR